MQTDQIHPTRTRLNRLRRVSVTTALVLLLSVLAACAEDEAVTLPDEAGVVDEAEPGLAPGPTPEADITPLASAMTAGNITVTDIADAPDAYIGETATVMGEVSAILGPQIFRMNEGNLLDIGDEILVVHTGGPIPPELVEDVRVLVTGTVRRFVQAEIEGDLGIDLGLDDEVEVEYESRPTIVADSITVIPTLSDIADDPSAYIGRTVTVSGEVSEILSPVVFRMNEDNLLDIGDEILVVHTGEPALVGLTDDAEILVTGTVRNFVVAEIEDDLGIALDLDADLEIEYENRVAIVADTIIVEVVE